MTIKVPKGFTLRSESYRAIFSLSSRPIHYLRYKDWEKAICIGVEHEDLKQELIELACDDLYWIWRKNVRWYEKLKLFIKGETCWREE